MTINPAGTCEMNGDQMLFLYGREPPTSPRGNLGVVGTKNRPAIRGRGQRGEGE